MITKALPFIVFGSMLTAQTHAEDVSEQPLFQSVAPVTSADSNQMLQHTIDSTDSEDKITAEPSNQTVIATIVVAKPAVAVEPTIAVADKQSQESTKLFQTFDEKALASAPASTTTTGKRNLTSDLRDLQAVSASKHNSAVSKSRAVQRAVSYTVRGKRYTTLADSDGFVQTGRASWYGKRFHGRKTASGEVFDMNAMTAAHKELPLGSKIEVTNNANGKKIVVTVNDRGPFHGNRVLDLSKAAAERLGVIKAGTADVTIRAL